MCGYIECDFHSPVHGNNPCSCRYRCGKPWSCLNTATAAVCWLHWCVRFVCRFVRHPGYMGWFIWSVATQLLLVNPVCTVVFALVVSSTLH
jgi:protein-S-isoprenylcysteine O-methyltransferase Ste14